VTSSPVAVSIAEIRSTVRPVVGRQALRNHVAAHRFVTVCRQRHRADLLSFSAVVALVSASR
jgi:hypothetical protein